MMDDICFVRGSVAENLARAVKAGRLIQHQDGTFSTPQHQGAMPFLYINRSEVQCSFLCHVLFESAYDSSAVPYGCRSCYKVKASVPDMRGLVALRGILEDAPYAAKCGVDLYNQYSRDIYAAFLYLDGLEAAQAAWRDMRQRVDAHPDLAGSVHLTIKRGCSKFEAACGPSDCWAFPEQMAEVEDQLRSRCIDPLPTSPSDYNLRRMMAMVAWIQVAYSIHDDTYLAFTDGKPLHRPTVTYPVEQP